MDYGILRKFKYWRASTESASRVDTTKTKHTQRKRPTEAAVTFLFTMWVPLGRAGSLGVFFCDVFVLGVGGAVLQQVIDGAGLEAAVVDHLSARAPRRALV